MQTVNHAAGSRSPHGAQDSWAQASSFVRLTTSGAPFRFPFPLYRASEADIATYESRGRIPRRHMGPRQHGRKKSPSSIFPADAAPASHFPDTSPGGPTTRLVNHAARSINSNIAQVSRAQHFRRAHLPLAGIVLSCLFVILVPTSTVPAKNWRGGAPWTPRVMHPASTNLAIRVFPAEGRRVWRLRTPCALCAFRAKSFTQPCLKTEI